ncbi:multiubiquitin domain-containing protein [Deinococcus ruber]|uniref:Multi-ubiquitin domain-containing protein n=1 Tax=Deinococcus ruber TaxID=1848197 RepID=A0A918FES9_9DEIO|nr:multiubiquitin domain-containing protein [Deinococcus ruber]GGR30299.1 hypothetical protein GCM10008957_46370 [Deinococcus ruber]
MSQHAPDRLYRLVIDGAEYTTSDVTLTPRQLKGMANLDQQRVVFLQLPQGQERRLADDEVTNLNGNEIEAFITRDPAELEDVQHYRFQVNETVYESKAPRITAADIRVIADLNAATPLFQLSGGHSRPVSDTEHLDLTLAGVEQFSTLAPVVPVMPGDVHVMATYTSNARTRSFQMPLTATIQQVVDEGYDKLKEAKRDGDTLFTGRPSRTSLTSLLGLTLSELQVQGLVHTEGHTLTFQFDIDTQMGGA